jgi:hypothetical protein
MFPYLTYLYNLIKNYFKPIQHNIPFQISNLDDFESFKQNKTSINKVVFALNNMPETIYPLLFRDSSSICERLFIITIKIQNKEILDFQHNIEDLNDHLGTKYILIRVNVIDVTQNVMHHVNCIILDNIDKNAIFFDSKVNFQYDVDSFVILVMDIINIGDYDILFPHHLGYNDYNKLQNCDMFCQTYVFFVFMLITTNENTQIPEYSNLFNTMITPKNLGYFLFHIHNLLKRNNFEICDQDAIWSFPTNKNNILDIINLFFNPRSHKNPEIENIEVKENDGLIIIETIENP